jgi:tRNA (guanine37-N1)-methyltransferase
MAGGHIPVEQWCIAVHISRAESVRKELLAREILDKRLKPGHEGDLVLFPVIEAAEGAKLGTFDLQKGHETLPRHELIGGLALMQEPDVTGAERLLHARPSLHTVLFPESPVEGEYRTRRFSILAGEQTTRTRYLEYGRRFDVDLGVAYFSSRLANERQRILQLMREEEIVLDMFAGVGPFAVVLAQKARAVYAADINPAAVCLMIENIRLNRCRNVAAMLMDAGHLPAVCSQRFDRIIMNLPMAAERFLDTAQQLCRPGGWIHFYTLQSESGEFRQNLEERSDGTIFERIVRTYSPSQHHAVYDFRIKK